MRQPTTVFLAILATAQVTLAGTWIGPDVLNNNWSNWSLSGTGSVMKARVGSTLQLGTFNYTVFNMNYSATATASRSVPVTVGKRYQYSVTGKRTRSVVREPISSSWWTEIVGDGSNSPSSSSSYSTQSLTTVATGSSMILRARSTLSGNTPAECNYCYGEFASATFSQVVYDPQLTLSSHQIRVNTDTRGGATGSVSLDLNSLSYADAPTAWSMDWGDGNIETNPDLNTTRGHLYSLGSADSQIWTATLGGSNEAGAGADSATITLLRQPQIALAIDGTPVVPGSTVLFDVTQGTPLSLSLVPAVGFIETSSFFIPGRLNQLGTDRSWSGMPFGWDDIGQTFTLTTEVSNTGLGVNSDTMRVDVRVVPEPATLVMLVLGGLAVMRRTRRG